MTNEFSKVMSEQTNRNLIKILFSDRGSYSASAIIAAVWEAEKRELDGLDGIDELVQNINNDTTEVIKDYNGTKKDAYSLFVDDCKKMNQEGYYSVNKVWIDGTYGLGSFLFALFLCFFLIGFLVFIYMIIVKPKGILKVTYELKNKFLKN